MDVCHRASYFKSYANHALRTLWIALASLVVLSTCYIPSHAQSLDSLTKEWEYIPAYGARAGYGKILHVGDRGIYQAFYDVPFGGIFVSPELVLYTGSDYAYGFNLKFKKLLSQGPQLGYYADIGIQFMTWEDRAHAGIPIDLSVTWALSHALELEATLNYTPLLFLGGEPGRGLFSILAGIRIPVP